MLTENFVDELEDDDLEEPSVGQYLKKYSEPGNVKQQYDNIFRERLEKTDGLMMNGESYTHVG